MPSPSVKVRSPFAVVALSVVTLCVYSYVWYFKVNRELRDFGRARFDPALSGGRPRRSLVAITLGAWLLVPAVWSLVATVGRIRGAERLAGRTPRSGAPIIVAVVASTALTFGLRFAGGPVGLGMALAAVITWIAAIALMQARLNGAWRAAGLGARDEQPAVEHGPGLAV